MLYNLKLNEDALKYLKKEEYKTKHNWGLNLKHLKLCTIITFRVVRKKLKSRFSLSKFTKSNIRCQEK